MKRAGNTARYELACELLPERLSVSALDIPVDRMAEAEEIRLRIGQPIHITVSEGELPLPQTRVIREDLEYVLDRATECSRYAASETQRLGFVTARGGYRVGICGTVVCSDGRIEEIRDISSLSIRIPRELEDIARPMLSRLLVDESPVGTLILSPPGGGKTTFLRDLVRLISNGSELNAPRRVSLVDERGEIAATYRGVPQLSVGSYTDVMDSCPKALAVEMLLRAMTPQVIALDEIAGERDVEALLAASNCGVTLLATVHASSTDELRRRAEFCGLLDCGAFRRAVVIGGYGSQRTYKVEVLA